MTLCLSMGMAMAQQPVKNSQSCQHQCGSCTHHQCQGQQAQHTQQNAQSHQHQCSGHQHAAQQNGQAQQHQCNHQHESCNHQCQEQTKGKPQSTKHIQGHAPKPQGDRKEIKPVKTNE